MRTIAFASLSLCYQTLRSKIYKKKKKCFMMLQTIQVWYLVDQFEKKNPASMNQLLAQIRFGLINTRSLLWFGPAVVQLTHVLVFNAAPEDSF